MNWRNPFLIVYLSVTVLGAAVLGYLLYAGYTHYAETDASYFEAVAKLQKLQNKRPFPSEANNAKYVEFTKEYRAEYDRLVNRVSSMQKPVQDLSPQAFQDLLRANVSEVSAAARENGVQLAENFYLGFDQYRGTLPPDQAAGPLARELAAIRLVVDNLISLKIREISGITRNLLPEEGGRPQAAAAPAAPVSGNGRPQRPNSGSGAPKVVVASTFDIVFVADQSATRSALNFIATADQFFIIRNLTVKNSAPDGPKRIDDAGGTPDGSQPALRVLVGRETLTTSLRIEMITFNNLPSKR